jgi:hypothetical protein
MTDNGKNCWNCAYQQIGGDTFLGICRYFETVGKENKEIPPNTVDKGCKFWKAKDSSEE